MDDFEEEKRDSFSVVDEQEHSELRDDADAVIANQTRSRNARAVMLAVASVTVFVLIICGLVVASFYVLLFPTTSSATTVNEPSSLDDLNAALSRLDANTISAHIEFLSSDLLEGRGTGTRGEELAVQYVTDQLRQVPRMQVTLQPVPLFGVCCSVS